MSFGSRLDAALRGANRTQSWLADRLGIPQPNVSAWVRDKVVPRADTVQRIATALGVRAGDLINDSERLDSGAPTQSQKQATIDSITDIWKDLTEEDLAEILKYAEERRTLRRAKANATQTNRQRGKKSSPGKGRRQSAPKP